MDYLQNANSEIETKVDTSLFSQFFSKDNVQSNAKSIHKSLHDTYKIMYDWAHCTKLANINGQSLDFTNYRFINYFNAFFAQRNSIQHLPNGVHRNDMTAQDFDGLVLKRNTSADFIDFNKMNRNTRKNNATMQQYSSKRNYDRSGEGLGRSIERGCMISGYHAYSN